MALPTFAAGNRLTAAKLTALTTALTNLTPVEKRKAADESVSSATTGTTLQDDDDLFVALRANTAYKVDLHLIYTEATSSAGDLKLAWSFPSGCTLDLVVAGPHQNWTSGAGANLEVEWSGAWQNVTSSPSSSINFGTINGANFGLHVRGRIAVGATTGNLQLRWAQAASSANLVTVKAGSSLILTPLSL